MVATRKTTPFRTLWLTVAALVIIVVGVRLRLVDVPLERDEGEYAYAGQLLLQGIPPFAEVYNMKMPGVYAAYACVLAVFGQTHQGIHLALLVVNVMTSILLFLFVKRALDTWVAVLSAGGFALMSLTPAVQGSTANAEHFVLLFAIAALFVLVRGIDSRSRTTIFVSGLLFGIAFLMKQHGALFIAFGCVLLVRSLFSRTSTPWRHRLWVGGVFASGVLIPFVSVCVMLWRAGVFDRFWFWTFTYGRAYGSQVPIADGLRLMSIRLRDLVSDSPVLWGLAVAGILSPLWAKQKKETVGVLFTFVALSFLATCPGLYFRPHYFILFLPAVALSSAMGIVTLLRLRSTPTFAKTGVAAGMMVIAAACQFVIEAPVYFTLDPNAVSRKMYGGNPFPESLEVARYVSENSSADDKIAVLGSEPQIYFYSRRRSATGYIYTYPLMEKHEFALKMQREMIEQIEAAQPKYIAFVWIRSSWLVKKHSDRHIFGWAEKYLAANYKKVRVYPVLSRDNRVELWEAVE